MSMFPEEKHVIIQGPVSANADITEIKKPVRVESHIGGLRYFVIAGSAALGALCLFGIGSELSNLNELRRRELEIKKRQLELDQRRFALDSIRYYNGGKEK